MSTAITNILQGFHNFNGITLGDRKKELFQILRQYGDPIPTTREIELLIEHLDPTSYLEHKMFVDILIYFKCEKELLTLFFGGNEKLIKCLWKHSWFFTNLLENSSIEWIIDEMFPQLSYVTRVRFIKNVIYYTRDEQKIDKLYDNILHKYGAANAQYILAGCSLEKIMNAISRGDIIKFSNKQVIFLHKNKKACFQQLISMNRNTKIFDFYDYHSKAFNIIAGSDLNIFFEVFTARDCSKIGKRLTKKILKTQMPYVIKEASQIYERVHRRTLMKSLGSNFENFFFSTWPSSFSDFQLYKCLAFMKYCPKRKYVEVLQQGLQKMYATSLSQHPELINDELLEKTDNIEMRESLLELKMQDSKEDYTLPKYYGIEKSVPILKKKISAADGVRTRENLIIALIKTCKINNDLDALLKVQEYFNFRHKNDDESIRSSFLSELKSCFDLTELNEEHWNFILEMIKWNKVKNEYFWGTGEIFMLRIKFLYKNDVEMSVISELFFETYLLDIFKSFSTCWALLNDVPTLQKFLLEKFMQLLPSLFSKEKEKVDYHFKVFETVLAWNKENAKSTINYLLYPEIREAIKIQLKKPCRSYSKNSNYLNNFIKCKIPCEDMEFLAELEEIFWGNMLEKFDIDVIEYYLRRKPMKLVEQFDKFILGMENNYLCDSVTVWRLVKHYDHISLVRMVIDYLISTTQLKLRGNLGIGLAILIEPEEYIKFMSTYRNEMLDVDDEVQVNNHHLSMKLLEYAKYNDSFTILPHVVQFCAGDTLHEALPPLYYYFQHSPEKYLLEHLKVLSDRAVSVRKHAVKLACSVSPVEIVYTLIQTMTEVEKNQSALEHIFWKTFKYFLVNKSERFWILLQSQMKSLDILESNAFKDSCDLKKIPKEYRLTYLDFIWKLLDEKEKQGQNVFEFKESIIESITSEMFKELPYEFCSRFIKEEFLKFGSKSDRTVRLFTLNCLKYSTQTESLLTDVCNIIREFKTNYILNPEFKISLKSRPYVDNFVSDIFYDHSKLKLSTLEAFFQNWVSIFSAVEDINNYIRLTLLIELKKVHNLEDFIKKVAETYKRFLNHFGIFGVVDCFKDALSYLLPENIFGTSSNNEKLYKLAFHLTELGDDDLKLLAISLLPKEYPENVYCIEVQQKLIEIFKESENDSVLLNVNLYINNLH
ncbi:uncharacterized protein LOC123309017 [Coccinella septempunctata]|uniref:uncharacterized protein LOC123309017 n=1 Tax=Coccinella septempunctata TaxID=41139 RepID=UPI001D08355E|nr:uncharacterized protein LOC123309017 [Coccinella septempunctata]XP_044747794.1 uncharacterized protein LOC123309017 [Coccinella septempunctata]